jgi:hypothetical protein
MGKEYAHSVGASFIECSAKTKEGMSEPDWADDTLGGVSGIEWVCCSGIFAYA